MFVSSSTRAVVATLFAHDFDSERTRIALPRPELHIVARFGPTVPSGLDVHVLGARERVVRKLIRRGQRSAMARLPLGAAESVLGVTAASLVGRIVPIADLWGEATGRRLADRLAGARDTTEAATVLECALLELRACEPNPRVRLALEAARRLAGGNVAVVAAELGVSERHLRRVFHDSVGLGPKAYAKLARFHRAIDAARKRPPLGWASIAVTAGYYDQAHLIAEFRAIAGATPRSLLAELLVGNGAMDLDASTPSKLVTST